MQSGPNPQTREGRVVDAAWMEEHMPDLNPNWHPDDEAEVEAVHQGLTAEGLMYKGKWLISPERQEKSMRFFWVSIGHVWMMDWTGWLTGCAQRLLLKNPFIPLIFRVTIIVFTTAALAIAVSIYMNVQRVNHDADPNNQCAKRASTYMAISVGAVALPYIAYVTWDEYMSKPCAVLPLSSPNTTNITFVGWASAPSQPRSGSSSATSTSSSSPPATCR